MKVLIIGIPGAGKSYLAGKMRKKGFFAIDADFGKGMKVKGGLVEATDKNGKAVKLDPKGNIIWKNGADCGFNFNRLRKQLERKSSVYIFTFTVHGHKGKGDGAVDVMKMFDKVYYLKVPVNNLKHRIRTRTNNDYGKDPNQMKYILLDKRSWDKKVRALRLKTLDSTLPAEKLIKMITSK